GRRTQRHESGVYQSADRSVKRGTTSAGGSGGGRVPSSWQPSRAAVGASGLALPGVLVGVLARGRRSRLGVGQERVERGIVGRRLWLVEQRRVVVRRRS